MGKTPTITKVVGTGGNDTLRMPAGYDITQVSFDGGRGGNDTLDLSTYRPGSTAGVTIDLIPISSHNSGSVVSGQASTGVSGSTLNTAPTVRGTIVNIENLIGTSGNDNLATDIPGISTKIDGAGGNDIILVNQGASAILIGGTGSDWLSSAVSGSKLIGGTLDASGAHGDLTTDTFRIGTVPVTIADFEVGTDRLLFGTRHTSDAAFAAGTWVDNGQGGSSFVVNGAIVVTLDGVSQSAAQTIAFGFDYMSEGGTLKGTATNDLLRAGAAADTILIGANSGNDLITNFNRTSDVLQFTNDMQLSWADTMVNGQGALVGSFATGSITLTGLSISDVASLHIMGLTTPTIVDTFAHPSFWSYSSDSILF